MQRGGAEMRTLELMRHINRTRFQFDFCTLSGLPGQLDQEILSLGGNIYPCPLNLGFQRRFGLLLRQCKYDVVHSHVHYFSGYILRLAAHNGVATRIAHFRITDDGSNNSLRRKLQKRLMHHWIDQYATNVLAVNEATMTLAWNSQWRSDRRCRVIYNGIDISPFQQIPQFSQVRHEFGFPEDCILYINVGNLSRRKNQLRVVLIFAEALKQQPLARLLLVGAANSEVEQQIRALLLKLDIADRVVLAQVRSDVPRLVQAADIFIFPSLAEGLPGAVLEACAAGTPVLASDLPGIREIAAYFPSVKTLSLDAPDTEWAMAAEALRAGNSHITDKNDAATSFATSVFNIDQCVKAHCDVWEAKI
jgi:glycosyltransferase involved in cell wall biosynthesis